MALTNNEIIGLTQAMGLASAAVCEAVIGDKLQDAEYEKAFLESMGFVAAYLYVKQSIDIDEASRCMACFVGVNYGVNREKFLHIAKAMNFYIPKLIEIEHTTGDFLMIDVIIYNLTHPHHFTEHLSVSDKNPIEIIDKWTRLYSFVINQFPKIINPVLEKLQ